MKICPNCVQFIEDHLTICDDCKNYTSGVVNWEAKEKEFIEIFNRFKNKGEKYDFIVPLSGGKDSSFVLHYMVKTLGARVLAVTWDNGLIREKSWENVYTLTEKLGVDLHIVKWDHVKLRKLLHATFVKYSKVCYCPFFVFLASFQVAFTHRIPAIITGYSEGQREMEHSFDLASQEVQKEKFTSTLSAWETFFNIALKVYEDESLTRDILKELFGEMHHLKNNLSEDTPYPYLIPLSNYINWTSFSHVEKLLFDAGWQNPAKTVSHSSCTVEPIKGYIEAKRNLNELRAEISYMVRCGGITREKGMEELDKINLDASSVPENIDQFCDFVYINKVQFFESIEKEMPDYPSEELKQKAEELKNNIVGSISWLMGIPQHKAKFY